MEDHEVTVSMRDLSLVVAWVLHMADSRHGGDESAILAAQRLLNQAQAGVTIPERKSLGLER